MSILIKGMTAEQLLDVFEWARIGANNCMIGHGVVATELPDHGDLIDREALMSEIADWQLTESPEEGRNWWLGKDVTSHEMQYCIYRLLGDVYEEVRDIPVVIPAEKSE